MPPLREVMKTNPLRMIYPLVLFILLSACGTKVDTGRNSIPRPPAESGDDGSGKKLDELGSQSCFGSSGDEPEILSLFCATLKDHQGHYFEKLTTLVCEEKKLYNLFLPECGWTGEAGEKPASFILPIEHTELGDKKSGDFYYMSAYGLTLGKSKKSLKKLLLFAYSDPEGFKKKFIFPPSTKVVPHEPGIFNDGQDQLLVYDMEIKGSATKIGFSSELRGYEVKKHFEVITERLLTTKTRINMRRTIMLSFPLPDGRSKIVVLEEFDVQDGTLHDIAFDVLTRHDESRMRLFYDNYQIKD